MDYRLTKQAQKAHRKELKHERKEARFHARAVNQAMRGNVVRAARMENRANVQHQRAQSARVRCDVANAKLASSGCRKVLTGPEQHCSCCQHHQHANLAAPMTLTHPTEPPPAYTVTSTTYYPTGIVAPPPATGLPPPYPGAAYPTPPYVAPTVPMTKA